MREIKKKEQGITLITLTVTVVVLIILAGIGIYSGKDTIKKAKLEELQTNLLLIQAKAREYVEEANFKIGIVSNEERPAKTATVREEIYVQAQELEPASNIPEHIKVTEAGACYYLTEATKNKWGLEKLKDEGQYIIEFDEMNAKVEVYNLEGYDGKYSLSEIDQIQE